MINPDNSHRVGLFGNRKTQARGYTVSKNHNIWSKDYSLDIKSSNYFPNTDKNSLQQSYKLNSEKMLTQKFV